MSRRTSKPKPALNRPDLDPEPAPKAPPVINIQAAPVEPLSAEEQAEQDAIARAEGAATHIDPVFVEPPEPGEQLDGQIETLRERVRVPEGATYTEILQAVIDGKWARKVVLATPFNRPINPHAHLSIVAHIRKSPWVGYEYETDTVIQRARNVLADKFLKSEAEWLMWMDQDTVNPFGQPGWMVEKLGMDPRRVQPPEFTAQNAMLSAIPRLLSHNLKFVGGVYRQRKPRGRYVIQPHLHPRNAQDNDMVRDLEARGPMDKVYEVGYVATGSCLVHRSVYEAVKEANPQLAPKAEGDIWNFYGTETNLSGEDIAFAKLYTATGGKCHLDLGVFCAHLGEHSYNP